MQRFEPFARLADLSFMKALLNREEDGACTAKLLSEDCFAAAKRLFMHDFTGARRPSANFGPYFLEVVPAALKGVLKQ